MKDNLRKWLLILRIPIIVLIGIATLFYFLKLPITLMRDRPIFSKKAIPEYDNLFDGAKKRKIKIFGTEITRTRHPESSYLYDDRFNIYVFKVTLSIDLPVNKIIYFVKDNSRIDDSGVYGTLPSYYFELRKMEGLDAFADKIRIIYSGGNTKKVFETDSVVVYDLKCKAFSIGYGKKIIESYLTGLTEDRQSHFIEIAFIKQRKFLKVVVINEANGNFELLPNTLIDILVH